MSQVTSTQHLHNKKSSFFLAKDDFLYLLRGISLYKFVKYATTFEE